MTADFSNNIVETVLPMTNKNKYQEFVVRRAFLLCSGYTHQKILPSAIALHPIPDELFHIYDS